PVAGNAAVLAEGVLNAMRMQRVKLWLAVLLAVGLAGAGAVLLAHGRQLPDDGATKKAEQAPIADDGAGQLRKSAEARLEVARSASEGDWTRCEAASD